MKLTGLCNSKSPRFFTVMHMSRKTVGPPAQYVWAPQPAAAQLIGTQLANFRRENPEIERFACRLLEQTGTRLVDWVDALVLPLGNAWGVRSEDLAVSGFVSSDVNPSIWENRQGMFPAVVLDTAKHVGSQYKLMFRCENVEDVCRKFPASSGAIAGAPGSAFRRVEVSRHNNVSLVAVERHGYRGFEPREETAQKISAARLHRNAFEHRLRNFDTDEEGFQHATQLIREALSDLGADRACDLFFAAERDYWMSRNLAARTQYKLQQELGLGWANHDHHTFRSSRVCFHLLVEALETLGFHCRERFYAGADAGWGAQVMQQSQAGYVVFADVDMSADEVSGDFAHQGLPKREQLGTVGLWCQLHGESFLQAGMHHLECQFDFDAATVRLASEGVETMPPFTDFPFLRQAFTQGEVWQIDPRRIQTALDAGQITKSQARQFENHGAIGSHLEILERNDGYKGFNQTGVSDIIARTDPRRW